MPDTNLEPKYESGSELRPESRKTNHRGHHGRESRGKHPQLAPQFAQDQRQDGWLRSGRLLLRHAVHRAEAPNQVAGIYRNDFTIREDFS